MVSFCKKTKNKKQKDETYFLLLDSSEDYHICFGLHFFFSFFFCCSSCTFSFFPPLTKHHPRMQDFERKWSKISGIEERIHIGTWPFRQNAIVGSALGEGARPGLPEWRGGASGGPARPLLVIECASWNEWPGRGFAVSLSPLPPISSNVKWIILINNNKNSSLTQISVRRISETDTFGNFCFLSSWEVCRNDVGSTYSNWQKGALPFLCIRTTITQVSETSLFLTMLLFYFCIWIIFLFHFLKTLKLS